MEFVCRGFARPLGEKTTLTKTDAIIEKIAGCYALFLSVRGTSEVNTSAWTSSLLRGAASSQVASFIIFLQSCCPWMLHVSLYLSFSSASTIFLLMNILLFPRPSPCPLKFLSFTSTTLFTLFLCPDDHVFLNFFFFSGRTEAPPWMACSGCFAHVWFCSACLVSPPVLTDGLYMVHTPVSLQASTSQRRSRWHKIWLFALKHAITYSFFCNRGPQRTCRQPSFSGIWIVLYSQICLKYFFLVW